MSNDSFYPSTALGSPTDDEIASWLEADGEPIEVDEPPESPTEKAEREIREAQDIWGPSYELAAPAHRRPLCLACGAPITARRDIIEMRRGGAPLYAHRDPLHRGHDCYERLRDTAR